jgi:hypothetical protein
MELHPVTSQTLRLVGYDAADRVLQLTFCNGGTYRYDGVPPRLAAGLLRAPSKGRFFQQRIRGHFPYRRLGQGGSFRGQ